MKPSNFDLSTKVLKIWKITCSIFKYGHNGARDKEVRKVLSVYWQVVWEQVHAGYKVDLPNEFGNLAIYKTISNPRETNFSKTKLLRRGHEAIYGPVEVTHRFGYHYQIKLFSPHFYQNRYEFKAASIHRKKLYETLTKTFFDYRSIEEYDKQVSEYKSLHPGCFRRHWG